MRTSVACAAMVLAASVPFAQTRSSNLSGHWQLVEPTASERALDTLAVTPPDQLLITDMPREIVIEHPSKRGTHPEAGAFEYGSGGFVVDGVRGEGSWATMYLGTQLVIFRSMHHAPDDRGIRVAVTHGSMWQLEGPDRLVIEFAERRTGERPKIATRVYVRVKPQ